ncbi:U3 small nucleolar RNA-associated protein MPP10 [Arthroderma uncinatum]|uniref:U3 small nucleolar RNA-associated protein MPP10 n=1 Tax=Arthroderma uncinatum TaxID=74035 RepID=UPI00144A4DEC|nr:U3 small nucleolar RNA-associated protein MPP10 [Arthroderma uncinatum]KAF3491133.1 U3 small nucleolar RNA-associated protein MPP10 [Arthroderma uncinatum]
MPVENPPSTTMAASHSTLPISQPEAFLKPSSLLYSDSVAAAKGYLDSLTQDLRQEQQRGQKRKQRTPAPQLHQLHVNGFSHNQIWEQAKRILDSALTISSRDIDRFHAQSTVSSRPSKRKASEDDSAESADSLSDDAEAEIGEDDEDGEEEMLDLDASEDEDAEGVDVGEGGSEILPEEDEDEMMEGDVSSRPTKKSKTDPHGLNDGFFSIDEFNKQSAFFENQDARRPHTNEVSSDEEDIDWDADPLALGDMPDGEDEDEDEDEENEDASGDEEDPDMGMDDGDSNPDDDDMELDGDDGRQARYEDFFDPPTNAKKPKPKPAQTQQDLDADIDRAMANVRRDLFDDDEMSEENDGADGKSSKNMSTHEKRRAQIADEIRRLEAGNVAKKDWTLMGEAQSNARPFNSLIEEDLEFERVGKPVPIITTEVSNDIESLIKRRIVTKEFDDIIRRRPLAIGEHGNAPKRKFELDETKPQHSLAEMYEADHLRSTDPAFLDKGAEKLRKEHNEVIQLWEQISSQLDTLSNWHFKPRKAQIDLNVVSNVDTIFMEDAQPTTRADSGAASGGMAPHEIYNPGETRTPGEIKLKSGASLAKDELGKEAKLRHRRRRDAQKKRKRESQAAASKPDTASAKKQQVVSSLKKGGVKVIGKGGNLTDVQGNEVRETGSKGRENLKL